MVMEVVTHGLYLVTARERLDVLPKIKLKERIMRRVECESVG
jgi:hypothetical protein